MSNFKPETRAIHTGYNPQQAQGALCVPIFQTTSYVFESAEQAVARFNLSEGGYIYTRLNNPTSDALEQRLAALEGGVGSIVTASGAAAVASTFLTLLKTGQHIVSSSSLYGGTYNLLSVTLPRLGITTTFVDASDVGNYEKAIGENTRAIFIEALGNPRLDIQDIEAVARVAHRHNIPLIVDNTVTTPALLRPIEFGANIVVHSLTKYICGNGTALGGAVIDGGNFNWANGKFPEFTEPSAGYHGLRYWEALGNLSFIVKMRVEGLRDFGGAASPFSSFQFLQGLETLDIRMKKHSENALALAQWLSEQPEVAWVNYPSIGGRQPKQLVEKYLPKGQSGIVTFGLKSGYDGAKKLIDRVQLFSMVANFGDTKSLIIHPASTTHQQLTEAQQQTTGVTPDLLRLSVGLEDIDDLKSDLKAAFS